MDSKTKFCLFALLILTTLCLIAFENSLFSGKISFKGIELINTNSDHENLDKIRVVDEQKWLINNLVAQYSPRLFVFAQQNRLQLDALVLYKHPVQKNTTLIDNLKFVTMIRELNGNVRKLMLDVQQAFGQVTIISSDGVTSYLWRVRTDMEIDLDHISLDSIVVALTDRTEFEKLFNQTTSNESSTLDSSSFLRSSFRFQRPIIDDGEQVKKPAIGHCVHMVRGLEKKKRTDAMKEWLFIQRRLGIDLFKMYFYDVGIAQRTDLERFMTRLGLKFRIVDYRNPTFEETCEAQIEVAKAYPASKQAQEIQAACKHFYESHLGNHWPARHTFELVATNDCIASLKHEYEYVINYDFDEFILPRRHLPTQDLTYALTTNLTCNYNNSNANRNSTTIKTTDTTIEPTTSIITNRRVEEYDEEENDDRKDETEKSHDDLSLYDFVTNLIADMKRTTNSSRKVAALHFKHMLMFDELPDQFVADLFNVSARNKSQHVTFNYHNMQIYFNLDLRYALQMLSAFVNTSELAKCRLLEAKQSLSIDSKWIRLYGVWMDVRRGKSVFNTDYADLVNQHELLHQSGEPGGEIIDVPLDLGYVSHFREAIDVQFFLGQTYSFDNFFRPDFECQLFISRLFSYYSAMN